MSVISKDLGAVTAYAAAVNRGYTGTREEFETLMASYAYVGEQAAESAGNASQSATNASQSATDAETAKGTAQQAATDAQIAQASAQGYAQSAQQSAQSASQSAQSAESAKDTAVDAVDGFAAGAQQALDSVNSAGVNWKSLAQAHALDSEAWAVGKRGGEDVGSSDPAYHNNAKWYAEHGSASAQTATEAAQTATTKAGEAQASAEAAAESARTLTIDATLTQAGQAADSKAVGDKLTDLKSALISVEKKYQYWDINLTAASYTVTTTDIYAHSGDVLEIVVTAQSNASCRVVGQSGVSFSAVGTYTYTAPASGYIQFYYTKVYCTIRFAANVVTSEYGNGKYKVASQALVTKTDGKVAQINSYIGYKGADLATGHYIIGNTVGQIATLSSNTVNFVYSPEPLYVEAGKTIHCFTRGSGFCCIAKNSTNDFATSTVAVVCDDNNAIKEYEYKVATSGYFWFSGRVNETTAYCDYGVTLRDIAGKSYIVDINGNGNYTSFTACLTALQNDTSEKTIYVLEGTYDIFEELGGADYIATITDPEHTNYRDVQPMIPPNTNIIGLGQVTLKFTPTAEQIGSTAMAFLFSPLNLVGTCSIENLDIVCTNCRYAIHQENGSLDAFKEAVHKLKNIRAKRTLGTYGHRGVCVNGIGARNRWEYESCSFEGDTNLMYSVHTGNSTANDMATIIMNNCLFVSSVSNASTEDLIQFVSGQGHATTRNIAKLNNCYCNGKLMLVNDTGSAQKWDVTLLGSTIQGVDVSSRIVDNPYPVKQYPPTA